MWRVVLSEPFGITLARKPKTMAKRLAFDLESIKAAKKVEFTWDWGTDAIVFYWVNNPIFQYWLKLAQGPSDILISHKSRQAFYAQTSFVSRLYLVTSCFCYFSKCLFQHFHWTVLIFISDTIPLPQPSHGTNNLLVKKKKIQVQSVQDWKTLSTLTQLSFHLSSSGIAFKDYSIIWKISVI